ncbi:hypothetical protein [Klebsiella variicola]|nr:hypothetical protein [Klebsiella variicola]
MAAKIALFTKLAKLWDASNSAVPQPGHFCILFDPAPLSRYGASG